jgi:putative addiction module component (TIGR02574 family)
MATARQRHDGCGDRHSAGNCKAEERLDRRPFGEQDFLMSRAAVQHVIALAAELSEDERSVVVDAIAPKESVSSLADEWQAEIARRADLVRSGRGLGKPAEDVFDRLESKLKAR